MSMISSERWAANASLNLIIYCFRLEFEDVPISNLARESRLVLQVFGRTLDTTETEESKNSNMPLYKEEEIGWAAVQFFDYEG